MSVEASSWAIRQRDLTPGGKLLLLVLANAAGSDGITFVGRATQAERCCCRPETVTENIKRLEVAGLVARVGRRRENGSRTSDYTILAPQAEDRGEMADASEDEYPEPVVSLARGQLARGQVRKPNRQRLGKPPSQVRKTGGPEQTEDPSVRLEGVGGKEEGAQLDLSGGEPNGNGGGPEALARLVLAVWNEETGQALRARGHVDLIARRVRENPRLRVEHHRLVIRRNLADPWWKGAPTPRVLYAKADLFESMVEKARGAARPQRPRETNYEGRPE